VGWARGQAAGNSAQLGQGTSPASSVTTQTDYKSEHAQPAPYPASTTWSQRLLSRG
jgi:hypothetical protein